MALYPPQPSHNNNPYLISQALTVLSEQIDSPALSQQDGSVSGGGRPGPTLMLMQDGSEAAVLGSFSDEVWAALLGVQGATLGPPASTVKAGATLDGGTGTDLLQHPVEGGGTRWEVVQGNGVGDAVHLRGALLLVGGFVVRQPIMRWQ